MVIDGHAHIMFPHEVQLKQMADAGISRTVLFTSIVHPETKNDLTSYEKELNKLYDLLNGIHNPKEERIRAIKDLVEVIGSHRDKYIGFGSVPVGLTYDENKKWLEDYIIANDLRGIGELTPGSGEIAKLEPLFRAARDCGKLPLWIHTFFPLNSRDIKELLDLVKRYGDVPAILGHLGGIHWLETLKAVRDVPNAYLDLSGTFAHVAIAFAVKEYPDRAIFGSDAPYNLPLTAKTVIEQLVKDKYVRQQVLGGNIAELLQL